MDPYLLKRPDDEEPLPLDDEPEEDDEEDEPVGPREP
jgi:hypothetical protein